MLIDSHCHLQHLPLAERRRALDRARAAGVVGFLVPAVRLSDADDLLLFCEAEPDVWCALGQHPHEAAHWTPTDGDRLRELLRHPKAVAVGECGLDFFYDHAPRDVQERVFEEQLAIARESGLPAVVHNRDSNERMLEVVARPRHAAVVCDFHSFAGGREMARVLADAGHAFGLSGMITFPRADNVRAAIAEMPSDRVLVETDTPYLAPVPYRGKPNEPAYVRRVAERLAEELGEPSDEVARRTTANFFTLFPRARA